MTRLVQFAQGYGINTNSAIGQFAHMYDKGMKLAQKLRNTILGTQGR